MTVLFTPHIQALPDTVPFVGPETLERLNQQTFKARVGANESAFGISPLATEALQEAILHSGCPWYPDPENFELRSQLSEKHDVDMANICVDAGIDSLLGLTIRLFIQPCANVVTSAGAYPTVNYHVNGYGGILHSVPYKNNYEDIDALAASAHATGASLVYLANPDNPMGTWLEADAINSLVEKLPDNCLLMLDEAYIEFMDQRLIVPVDTSNDRVIRYRTFSKAYGLAGMRIGYVIAHHSIIAGFNRIRNHFGVNRLAQIAATASLRDTSFLPGITTLVEQGRQRIYAMAEKHKLPYLPSATNFVAVDFDCADKANAILNSLLGESVFVRKPAVPPLHTFIRFGVGNEQEHHLLESTIDALLKA